MRAAVIVDGRVENIVICDAGWRPPRGNLVMMESDAAGAIGWSWSAETGFAPPPGESPEEALARWREATEVTQYQMRVALRELGFMAAVETWAETAGIREQEAWLHATTIRRLDPMVLAGAVQIGIPEGGLDTLFEYALAVA